MIKWLFFNFKICKTIAVVFFIVLLVISVFYIYEMFPFARGVQNDFIKRKGFHEYKSKSSESSHINRSETINSNL
jgi:hypothetical protein